MQSFTEVAKLCNEWLKQPPESFTEHQKHFALEFLSQLEWEDLAAIDMAKTALPCNSYLMRVDGEPVIAGHFLTPGALEPPSSVLDRGLDFCQCTRLLVNGTRKLSVPYAFISDFGRSYLYDTSSEELLLFADSPEFFARDMAAELMGTAIKEGELDEVRRSPRSAVSRSLREWRARWDSEIGKRIEQNEDESVLIIDRLLILRFLFDADIAKCSKWSLRGRFSKVVEMAFRKRGRGCGEALTGIFHDIWFQWKAEFFKPTPILDELLQDDQFTARLLQEFTLLSKTKFTIPCVLESFNYGDAMEKARVRIVPEPNELRERQIASQSPRNAEEAHVSIDVVDEGYRAIVHWFDKLVEAYDRQGLHYDAARTNHSSGAHPADLFAWSELDAKAPSGIRDKFQRAIEKGLAVYVLTPRQYRTARLILYLHLIEQYAQSRTPFTEFPLIEAAIRERPKNFDTQRGGAHQAMGFDS